MNTLAQDKLAKLAEIEGLTIEELCEQAVMDVACKGICMVPRCDYTTDVEPDQEYGYCENCGGQTVKSCLVLAGII
jgi:hypothetical protein